MKANTAHYISKLCRNFSNGKQILHDINIAAHMGYESILIFNPDKELIEVLEAMGYDVSLDDSSLKRYLIEW